MALLSCPECGSHISSLASVCPSCGCPTAKMKEMQQQAAENLPDNETFRLAEITKRTHSGLCVICGEKFSLFNKKVEVKLRGNFSEPGLFFAKQHLDVTGVGTPLAHAKCATIYGSEGTDEGRRILVRSLLGQEDN